MTQKLQIQTPRVFAPLLHPARYKGAWGGRGCCHPDTLIDTPFGQVKISEFKGGAVYSYLNGKIVIAEATPAVQYNEEQLYLVVLADGRQISVTDQHKFLTNRGWVQCCDLSTSDGVVVSQLIDDACLHHSIQGICRPKLRANDLRCFETHEDYQGDYYECFRQYGQQPRFSEDTGKAFLPLLSDGQQHILRVLTHLGGLVCENINNLLLPLFRLSSQDALRGSVVRNFEAQGNCSAYRTSEQPSQLSQVDSLFRAKNNHLSPLKECYWLAGCCDTSKSLDGNSQKEHCKSSCAYFCSQSSFLHSCNHDLPIVTNVKSICKHDRIVYWDLHVPVLENYLSNGIVNHNSGKSHFFAEMLIEDCIREKIDAVCLREVQKSLKFSVKKLLESKIQSMNAGDYFEVQNEQIKSRHGGVIIFQGMQDHTSDSIKSLEGFKRAWFEEAQSASQRSLDLLRPTIRSPGSELWFSWNPNLSTDPIDVLLRGDNHPPSSVIVKANYKDNPWLPSELLDEMEYDKSKDPDKYAHIWLGEYQRNSEARVFRNWKVEEFERPEGTIFRFGADWGFSVDPSVLIRCSIEGNRLYIDYEAYSVGCEIVNLPELFLSIPEAEKWPITADSARPETISHMQKNGFPRIRAAIKGSKSIEDGIEWLKSYDIIVHPRCLHTIDELTLYCYKTDPLTGAVIPVLGDKNNHVIDALRYACEGARRIAKQKEHPEKPIPKQYYSHNQGWMR